MKTKILLIGLIIFLVNVISVNAKETIKVCSPWDVWNFHNYFVFPGDGGKPYGSHVGTLLSLTNSLNLAIFSFSFDIYGYRFGKFWLFGYWIPPTQCITNGYPLVKQSILQLLQ